MAAPRAPQDRRSPARKSPAVTSLVEITRPVADPETPAEERIPVFSIDGTVYDIPKRVPAAVTLKTLEDLSEHGQEVAITTAVRKVLGPDAWQALTECDYLTDEQLGTILSTVTDHIIGAMEKVSKQGK